MKDDTQTVCNHSNNNICKRIRTLVDREYVKRITQI